MLVSYVLRLMPNLLSVGEVVGEVEVVATGERIVLRGADELLAVLLGAQQRDEGGDQRAHEHT